MTRSWRGALVLLIGLTLILPTTHGADPGGVGALKPLRTIQAYKDGEEPNIRRVSFSPDGKLLAGATGKHLRLWDPETGKLLRETTIKVVIDESTGRTANGNVRLVGFLDEGRLIACDVGASKEIHWLDTETLKIKHTLRCTHKRTQFGSAAVSPEGNSFAALERRSLLTLWDSRSAKQRWQRDLDLAEEGRSLTFSPDGKWLLLTFGNDETFRVLEAASGKDVFSIVDLRGTNAHVGGTWPVFSPDGKALLAGVWRSPELCLVEARKKGASRLLKWEPPPKDPCPQRDLSTWCYAVVLAFSVDGNTLLAGCNDKRLRVWEVPTGGEYADIALSVDCLAFSPQGSVLATATARAGEICLWDWRGSFREKSSPLSDEAAARALADLRSREASVGRAAMSALLGDPKQALANLKQLPRVEPATEDELARLIEELDHQGFATREKAERRLDELGRAAEAALRKGPAKSPSQEGQKRIQRLLEQSDRLSGDNLRSLRAVEVLERVGTDESAEILKRWASGARGAFLTEQARVALTRLKKSSASVP